LARVVTSSTNNTTSALNSLHWLPIQQRINFKLAILAHRALNNAGPQYLPSLLYPYTLSQLRSASSISSPNLVSTLLLPLVVFDMLALLSFLHHHRYTNSYTVYKSILKTQLTFSLVQAFLAPNNSIHAFLIQHNHVDFASSNYIIVRWPRNKILQHCSNYA